MIYYSAWIALVIVSLWASLVAFVWAVKTGQFSDQSRARYLPLVDRNPATPAGNPAKLTREVYALLLVLGLGAIGLLCAVFLSWVHLRG